MKLVIVESPAKGKTIEKYLGPSYKVLASFGHVRDLPKKNIGIDIKNNFTPTYEIPDKAKKNIQNLKSALKNAETLYLATDYDREGEAIAYHLIEVLKPKIKYKRITFHEITKPAITEAIKNPREINANLVDAQQARRVLDRLVGYKLSPFLWLKVARGLSAGRVQSVAVRLIVEREQEIEKFSPVEFWQFEAELNKKDDKKSFLASFVSKNEKKLDKFAIKNKKEAEKIEKDLKNAQYKITNIKKESKKRYPAPPFTTSTMQQEAGYKLGYSAKQTMRLAQNLYEDGFITYMRTDSVNISSSAQNQARKVIEKEYGKEYLPESPRFYKTKTRNAQEAHEAIRPTDLAFSSSKIPLSSQHQKLFNLIRAKMLASQAKEAEIIEEVVEINALSKDKYYLEARGIKINFPGFLAILKETAKENILPKLNQNDELNLIKLFKKQRFTEPPTRYTEGGLIKELEKRGIGRPSTYAPTISTIVDRGYVSKESGKLIPSDIARAVNDVLVENFPKIVDYDFTAKMENELDDIAEGKTPWQKVCKSFYQPFSKNLAEKTKTVSKKDLTEKTNEKCPKCGNFLVIKIGRFGKFYACEKYPECKFTKPLVSLELPKEQIKSDQKCPKCNKNMILKESRYGPFLACEGYPECKYTQTIEVKAEAKCPNCGGDILRRRSKKGREFWGCKNFPKCKTAFWNEPINKKCEKCSAVMTKDKKGNIKCSKCKG